MEVVSFNIYKKKITDTLSYSLYIIQLLFMYTVLVSFKFVLQTCLAIKLLQMLVIGYSSRDSWEMTT